MYAAVAERNGGMEGGDDESYHIPYHHPPTIPWQRRGKAGTNHMGGEAKKNKSSETGRTYFPPILVPFREVRFRGCHHHLLPPYLRYPSEPLIGKSQRIWIGMFPNFRYSPLPILPSELGTGGRIKSST